jgi:hypothetical protein
MHKVVPEITDTLRKVSTDRIASALGLTVELTQLAARRDVNILYSDNYNRQILFVGDYGFYSHFRVCLFKIFIPPSP